MFSFFSNTSIARRLTINLVLAAIIPGIIILILGSSYITYINSINQTIQSSNNATKLITGLQADVLRLDALASTLENTNDSHAIVQSTHEIAHLMHDLDTNSALYEREYQIETSPNMNNVRHILQMNGLEQQVLVSQRSMIFIVHLQWQLYKNSLHAILQDLQPPVNSSKLTEDLPGANLLYLPLKGNIDNLVALTENLSQIVVQANSAETIPLVIGTIVAFLASMLIVFMIGYYMNHTITYPLHQLAILTTRIGKGETTIRARVDGNNEISRVAASMNRMLDNIVHLMQETQAQRDLLQMRVERMISEVSNIGVGDLRTQVQITPDEFGILARAFNYMVRELENLVVRVKIVSNEVDELTTITLNSMNALVKIEDQQIEQITLSAGEVEHMTRGMTQVAERTCVLSNLSVKTQHLAYEGRDALQQVIGGMERIRENTHSTSSKVHLLSTSSQEITNIATLISSIAYQTNRLALDATIQAAMAGDHGKGFAAVASDIRRLAEQTKEQTGMIASIIRTAQDNIRNATASMLETENEVAEVSILGQDTTCFLSSIFEAIEQQAKEIDSIDKMTRQQLETSCDIATRMHDISFNTRRSSESIQLASANMWKLVQLVEQLRVSVEAFQLSDSSKHKLPPHHTAVRIGVSKSAPDCSESSPKHKPLKLSRTRLESPE
jgi:methyl-accepting chemotaxis protein